MEIRSDILNAEQLHKEIDFVANFTEVNCGESVCVMYGFGCRTKNPYEEITVKTRELREFIASSSKNRVFQPGEDDLHIVTPTVEFTICHEGDIHVKSNQVDLLDSIKTHWANQGYSHYEVAG